MKLKLSVVFITVFAVFFVFSCKKVDITPIGGDLIPAVDNVSTFDTVLEVFTDNFLLSDSSRILRDELHALGVIGNDAEFGKTKSEIFFSLTPPGYGTHPFPQKDSALIIDSVVLAISYNSIYGDTQSIEKIDVHEIDADAYFPDLYYGYRVDSAQIQIDAPILGSKLVDFSTLNDSVYDIRKRDTLRIKNQLRIQLDKSLADRFLAYDTSNAYKNDSVFRSLFKGVALKIDEAGSPVKKGLAYFTLNTDDTKLVFYYRVKSGSVITDTVFTEFGFYAFNAANANSVVRTPGNNYLSYLNNTDTSDDKMYLQSSPGSYSTIWVPGLKNIPNSVIHRAELIVEALPSLEESTYGQPAELFLDAIDTTNQRFMTVPYDFSYSDNYKVSFGGLIKNNIYTFKLSRYVQGIITRKEKDYKLRLYAPFTTRPVDFATGLSPSVLINTPIGSGRVVLAGGKYPDATKKARLRIIYTKI